MPSLSKALYFGLGAEELEDLRHLDLGAVAIVSHPGEIFWSSAGAGSATQMPVLLLHSMTNTKVTDVLSKAPAHA